LRPAGRQVAEADDVCDVSARKISEDGVEGDAVAMDVADQGQAAHASTTTHTALAPIAPP